MNDFPIHPLAGSIWKWGRKIGRIVEQMGIICRSWPSSAKQLLIKY
jgi:hypothetical protein